MIECPSCGANFRGAKCSCGYEPPKASPAEIAERMRKARDQYRIEHEQKDADFAKKQEVFSNVNATGKKKWAHEVLALASAGIKVSEYSVMLAKAALRIQDKEAA